MRNYIKWSFLIGGGIFIVTLTVTVGLRVSADALAVIIGVVLGIVASVPTTLLVIFVISRQQNRMERMQTGLPQHPPVVVVNGADKAPSYANTPALPAPHAMNNGARKWTVIGGLENEE